MTAAVQLGLSTLGQIALPARDVARSVEFYRDKLGIRLLFQGPNMAFFDCGGVRLMLGPMDGAKLLFSEQAGSIVYFKVEDIGQATAALKARGIAFERDPHPVAKMPDHELWHAFFRDPDGNVLGLMCEQRSST